MNNGERERPLPFFRRTSTCVVWDSILTGNHSFEMVKQDLQQRGHHRQDHDIRAMVGHLERVGIVREYQPTDFGRLVEVLNHRTLPVQNRKIIAQQVLEGFIRQGFLLRPFLAAFADHPTSNKGVAAHFFPKARLEGYYNLNAETDYNDFVPAMKNFLRYLGFLAEKRFALTDLGKAVLAPEEHDEKTTRFTCGVEYCRRVCPANAIHASFVQGCVNCLLCLRCCPYGAVTYNNGSIAINFDQCVAAGQNALKRPILAVQGAPHNHIQQPASGNITTILSSPDAHLITSDEGVLQNWLASTFKILHLHATVMGPGEQPDLAVNLGPKPELHTQLKSDDEANSYPSNTDETRSALFECKKDPITGKKVPRIRQQLERYMQPSLLEEVRTYLGDVLGFSLAPPQNFIVFAPAASEVRNILDVTSNLPYPVSFVSFEAMLSIYKGLVLERKSSQPARFWEIFRIPREDISMKMSVLNM